MKSKDVVKTRTDKQRDRADFLMGVIGSLHLFVCMLAVSVFLIDGEWFWAMAWLAVFSVHSYQLVEFIGDGFQWHARRKKVRQMLYNLRVHRIVSRSCTGQIMPEVLDRMIRINLPVESFREEL